MNIMLKRLLLFMICLLIAKVDALCPYKCSCDHEPTSCPVGVSLVTDGCNCCKICARQEGQSCDNKDVCDPHRGLVCDFTIGGMDRGLCKAQLGRSCTYEGRTYMNGEMFQPTCKHQCWCMDGTVGCLSLCPHETRIPQEKECPGARLDVVEGECCERWLCGFGESSRVLPLENFWDKYVDETSNSDVNVALLPNTEPDLLPSLAENIVVPSTHNPDSNRYSYQEYMRPMSDYKINTFSDGGSDGDELIDYQMAHVLLQKGGKNMKDWFGDDFADDDELYEYENWAQSNGIVGDDDTARRKTSTFVKPNCGVQTTSWTPCSKTCGLGLATRVTNNNPSCKLTRESRLCNLRPCDNADYATPKRGKHCLRQKRQHRRTYYKYANCRSIRAYRPRYCGGCNDGRCCTPHSTRTVRVRFRCENSQTFVKSMLMIRSCRCHYSCSVNPVDFTSSRDMHNDTYRSNDA